MTRDNSRSPGPRPYREQGWETPQIVRQYRHVVVEVQLDGEAATIANQIRSIDGKLDELDRRVQGYIAQGLRFAGAFNIKQRGADDKERDELLAQRQELAQQLKRLTRSD